ncbi:hypothetical protein GQ651_01485 [Alphaproteobacteria bacterium GH1-50]|uniref:Response regulatory domain-containing protein n=1 Tax=Kangsaoukella pontilimi TaxID=2691042 RepID=A0A7C9IM81_9RHOB|nr:hypothetical protein [Kangsaoukella pontilimi]MXQ06510.1 hypothetical protein [Kangsaoukella pontilimi]
MIVSDSIPFQIGLRSTLRATGLFRELISLTDAEDALLTLADELVDIVFVHATPEGDIPLLDRAVGSDVARSLEGRVVVLCETPLPDAEATALKARAEVRDIVGTPLAASVIERLVEDLPPRHGR